MAMIGNKPASLSSGLLARKGHARPAMRSQGYVGLAPHAGHEDLGWNDMGEDHAADAVAPATALPPVLRQREALKTEIVRVVASPRPAPELEPEPEPQPRPVATSAALPHAAAARIARDLGERKSKAAFTLRLDPERHLRLRLASAIHGRSAQQLVTEALDAFLNAMPEVETLARQLPPRARRD